MPTSLTLPQRLNPFTWGSLALLVALAGCAVQPVDGDLLSGKKPLRQNGVLRADTLTDGVAAAEGGAWDSALSAVMHDTRAEVVWDLGERTTIGALWLQADGNDRYEISLSDDGSSFTPVWVAPEADPHGLMARAAATSGAGRYLKVRPLSGDGAFSISELMAFRTLPSVWPPHVPRHDDAPADRRLRDGILLLGSSLLVLLALSTRRTPLAVTVVLAAWPLWACFVVGRAMLDIGIPIGGREVGLARGTLGFVAAAALLWESYAPARLAPRRAATLGVLWVCGVLGVASFYHLGQPQFFDRQSGKWTFIHFLDLRQYQATVKYFPEIGYFGIYEADLAAYAEDTHRSIDSLASLPVRDLHTNLMTTAGALRADTEAIRSRFTPERWADYKRDAAWFRSAMGDTGWLETLADLGGNATPVWMSMAYVLLRPFDASHTLFVVTGLLDPLLFLVLFWAVWRSFGPRTAAAVMVVFGANDFIMYGTNWAGATLRHDWMVYLGLGACALRLQRYRLGGALIALSASIRAFPAFALLGAALPSAIAVFEGWRASRKWPSWSDIRRDHRGTVEMVLAAAVTAVALVVLSSIVLGPSAWPSWVQKVGLLGTDAHPNPISLRTVISGSGPDRYTVLAARSPIFLVSVVAFVVLTVLAARGKRPEQGAMLGIMMVPILMFPANYYAHFVCLLPMLAVERPEGFDRTDMWLVSTLLLMCAAQYFTVLMPDLRLHFWMSSVTLVVAFALMLVGLVRRDAWSLFEDPRGAAAGPQAS